MSLDFLYQVLDEIALEGLDGITLSGLWLRLSKRQGFPVAIDEKSKNYLWRNFAGHGDLLYYELPEPRSPLEVISRFDFLDPDTGFWIETDLGRDIYPLQMVTGKEDQGSCATFDTRKNVTEDIRDEDLKVQISLDEVNKRWGDKLVLVASQALRSTTLYGEEAKSTLRLDCMEYCLLERIARSRHNGEVTTHGDVTGSLGTFKIESKKLFYHLKKLVKLKLIIKQVFCIRDERGKQLSCRLVQLKRFFSRTMSKNRCLIEAISRYLEAKENQCELTAIIREDFDIADTLFRKLLKERTWFHVVDVPYRQYYPDAAEEEFLTKSLMKERNLKVVKLVKPFKDELEEEEEEEEDVKSDAYAEVPWIYERTLLQQAMIQFDKAGAEGLKQTHLQSMLRLPRLECRTIIRNLLKAGHITSVMKSFGKQRTSILIATKFYNASDLNKEFDLEKSKLMEHMQEEVPSADDSMVETDVDFSMADQTMDMTLDQTANMSTVEVKLPVTDTVRIQTSTSTPHTPAPKTPAPKTPAPRTPTRSIKTPASKTEGQIPTPEGDTPGPKTPASKSSTSLLATPAASPKAKDMLDIRHLTALKLRRANKVLDALKETRVFENVSALYKLLLTTEAEEGSSEKMDRKTMKQLVTWLKSTGKIRIIKTLIQQGDKAIELEFLCAPDVSPQDQIVKTFIQQAKMKHFGMKKKYGKATPKTEKEFQEIPDDLPDSLRESISKFREYRSKLKVNEMVYDASSYAKYNFLPKAKRYQMTYIYLHYLMYSYSGKARVASEEVATLEDVYNEDPSLGEEQTPLSILHQIDNMKEPTIFHEEMSFKRYLAPLQANHGHGPGWCLLGDVMVLMPINVFCQVVSLPYRIEGLVEILEHPTKRFYPVISLPPVIRQQVLFARRYTQSIYESCYQLALMGLLSFGPAIFKEKDKCFIYLHKKTMLLDTRASEMAYCRTWPEGNGEFKEQYYNLETDEDVHMYWCDLEVIALNSNLGCKGGRSVTAIDNEEPAAKLGVSLCDALQPVNFQEDPETPYLPGDRRGAAGFDSSLFLHLIRNWSRRNEGSKKRISPSEIVKKKVLKRKKNAAIEEKNVDGTIKFSSKNKTRRMSRVGPQQKVPRLDPTEEVAGKLKKTKGNKGGKGIKRKIQDPFLMQGTTKKKKVPKIRTALSLSKNRKLLVKRKTSEKIRKKSYDEIDRSALSLMIQERVNWTAKEDTVILLCKTASLLMGRHRRGIVVPWTVVRDILHEVVPDSRDKTSTACQRRISFGMKNMQTLMNVSIFLGEAHQDQAIMEKFGNRTYNYTDPGTVEIFKECVKTLMHKFTSEERDKVMLPSTVQELENYIVKTIGPLTPFTEVPEVAKERDIYYYTLQNLIHSYICAQRDKQGRIHEMYRLFKQYPDELLVKVFDDMNKMGLITKVKNEHNAHIKKKQFATAITHKKLTQKYYFSFHSRYPQNLFAQSYTMLDKIVQVFTTGVKDSVELKGNMLGGHVATVCGLFALKKLNFCVRIPEDILIVDEVGLGTDARRGKVPTGPPSAPSTSTATATTSTETMTTETSTGTIMPGNEMEVVQEVEVTDAVWDSNQTAVPDRRGSSAIPPNAVPPTPSTSDILEDPECSIKRRNCRSLIIIEGDVDSGAALINKVASRNASRSLLSLARNKVLTAVDFKSTNVQDHFVINSCDIRASLHLASTVVPTVDNRLTEKEMDETKSLFLKPQKAKEMYRKHLVNYPFLLELAEVWEHLGQEYGSDDVAMIKKVYDTISANGSVGMRETAVKDQFKSVCNVSLVIMVLLEQKAVEVDKDEDSGFRVPVDPLTFRWTMPT